MEIDFLFNSLLKIVEETDKQIDQGETVQSEHDMVLGDLVKTQKAMGYEKLRTALLRRKDSISKK